MRELKRQILGVGGDDYLGEQGWILVFSILVELESKHALINYIFKYPNSSSCGEYNWECPDLAITRSLIGLCRHIFMDEMLKYRF